MASGRVSGTGYKTPKFTYRIQAIQTHLKLLNCVTAWLAAHELWDDVSTIADDLYLQLEEIAYRHEITDSELEAAKDPSVRVSYNPYP